MEKWERRRSTTKCSRMSVFRCCVISSEGATKFPTIRSISSKYSTQYLRTISDLFFPVPERIVFPFQEILFIPGSVTNNCNTNTSANQRRSTTRLCFWILATDTLDAGRKKTWKLIVRWLGTVIDLFLEKRVQNFVDKEIHLFLSLCFFNYFLFLCLCLFIKSFCRVEKGLKHVPCVFSGEFRSCFFYIEY